MQWIFLLFPLLELWTLIELGSAYGAMVAIGWVVLTIVLGLSLIRRQGLSMIRQIQREAEGGLVGARLLGDDIAVVTSGLLLMIPGLVTDVLAVLVLIGPLRRRLLGAAPARFRSDARVTVTRRYTGDDGRVYTETRTVRRPAEGDADSDGNVTVEGDYRRLDDD